VVNDDGRAVRSACHRLLKLFVALLFIGSCCLRYRRIHDRSIMYSVMPMSSVHQFSV